jgi:GDP-L-fucose synthase
VDARLAGAPAIEVWGDGEATREFLYVDDAARGILLAAEHYDGAEPVNLGSGREVAIHHLVKLIATRCGFHGEIRWDRSQPNGQPRRCLDTRRARQAFGFEADTSLEAGLDKTVAWYLDRLYERSLANTVGGARHA